MSKWPSYRKGAKALSMAAPRAVALGAGFQMPTAGGLLQAGRKLPFYPKVGGVLRLFNLSAPGIVLGVGLAGIKFINWWQTRPEGVAGYEKTFQCQPGRGVFLGSYIYGGCAGVYMTPSTVSNPTAGRPALLHEWKATGKYHGVYKTRELHLPIATWTRVVTDGPQAQSPGIRVGPIWFPTNVLGFALAGHR